MHVNIPFCAAFPEVAVLADFLAETLVPQAERVSMLGAEYDDSSGFLHFSVCVFRTC